MPLNKQQLLQENNTNFPNNNSQLITPELLRQFNADMIDSMQLTQSMSEYAVLNGGNTFTGNQTITGNLNVTGVISASVLYVQTETASVIYSSGSNQFGDALDDTQILSGSVLIVGSGSINGQRILTTADTGSISFGTGSLVTTASFNAYTQSTNQRLTSLETNSASVNVSISNLNQTTASLNTSVTALNQFTQSQQALNGTFATTGSNTFTGNQIIDRASKLYTNGVYWTDMTAGFNNLEIINQGGGNLDFASLNGGRMRVVNTPLQLTGSILSSNSDISTSANVYGANLITQTDLTNLSASLTVTDEFLQSQIDALDPSGSAASITLLNAFTASQELLNDTFATTGSNTFTGQQNIQNTLVIEQYNNPLVYTQLFQNELDGTLSINQAGGNGVQFSGLNVSMAELTASLQEGYVWVGDSTGRTATVATSSFGGGGTIPAGTISGSSQITALGFVSSSVTASSLITASAAGSTITFTKGDSTTFNVTLDTGSATSSPTIYEVVYTGENITKGDPLYISGSQGANPIVFKADAADPNKMPVTFVSNETIGVNNTTNAIILGLIEGMDLTGLTAGQAVYVAEGGGWSTSLPSGSNSITQLLGVVTKGGSGGKGLVLNPGPAQLPGLDTGKMWVGNGNNQPIEINTASFASSASFNSYTSSTNSRLTNIESTTASLLIETQNLELFSASALSSISQLNASSASQQISINNLNTTTASLLIETQNLELFSASALISINSLNGATGSFATTGSNTFTGEQRIYNNQSLRFANQGTFSGDIGSRLSADSQTGMQFRNFSNNDMLFEQNGTASLGLYNYNGGITLTGSSTSIQGVDFIPFSASLNSRILAITGSGGTINTGSFATTGSNAFFGTNTFSGAVSFTGSAPSILSQSFSGSLITNLTDIYTDIPAVQQIVTLTSASYAALASGSLTNPNTLYIVSGSLSGSGGGGTTDITSLNAFTASQYVSNSFFATTGSNIFNGNQTISGSVIFPNGAQIIGNAGQQTLITSSTNLAIASDTSISINAISNLNLSGSNTFLQGLRYPNFDGTPGQVLSTDGAGVLTFTSVSGSGTINTGSFATTGSNTFVADQTVSASILVTGNVEMNKDVNAGVYFPMDGGKSVRIQKQVGINRLSWVAEDNAKLLYLDLDTDEFVVSGSFKGGLQNGYAWVGQSDGYSAQVPTSSFAGAVPVGVATTGSNTFTGDQTFTDASGNFFTISDTSGSLMLVGKSYTSASAHLSSSVPSPSGSFVNLIWKTNNNTADTIISGSNNIFPNPSAPIAGFKRYIGGSNNIFNSLTIPQISGSMQFSPNMSTNIGAGTYTFRGPVSSSAWNLNSNINLGSINIGQSAVLNAEKLTAGLNLSANILQGTINIAANQSALTGSTTQILNNSINGGITLNLSSSAAALSNNVINDSGLVLTNQFYSSSLGLGVLNVNRNNIGGQGNQIITTGAQPTGTNTGTSISDNFIFGGSNILFADVANARVSGTTAYHNAIRNGLLGNQLIVSASSVLSDTTSFGSVFAGRWNANDGIRNKTSDIIFAVGTGTSTSNRKTGFLIDSGSNSYFEGAVSISGSLLVNGATVSTVGFATTGSNSFDGNQKITGSLTMSGSIIFVDRSGNDTNTYLGLNALGMGFAGAQPLAEGNTIAIAIGQGAMRFASGSSQNVAIGNNALLITTGSKNFAMGSEALSSNTTGQSNIAIGTSALTKNTTGDLSTAIGDSAGFNASGSQNTFIGQYSGYNITGSNNTILGSYQSTAGTILNNNIVLADGQGNVQAQYSGSAWSLQGEIKLNKGSNKPADIVSTDSSGTVTVYNSLVTSNSIILVTVQDRQSVSSVYPAVVGNKTAGEFTIYTNVASPNQVAYLIINPTA